MEAFDEFARGLEVALGWAFAPLRPVVRSVDRYLARHDASPLGQTLVVCSPMLAMFLLVLLVIDFR